MFEILNIDKYRKTRISDLIKEFSDIDLSPSYQRLSKIWSDDKQVLLIDSIINGYDIPKIYFHYIITKNEDIDNAGKKLAVIDGKQRINAILRFVRNELRLDGSVKFLKNPELDLDKLRYSDLDSFDLYEIKKQIDNYILDIVTIKTDEEDRIEEMFLRLNEGKPVNNAEKRNAIGGELINAIKDATLQCVFFNESVPFGNNRMEHFDLMLKLCYLESVKGFETFSKANLDRFVKHYKITKSVTPNRKATIRREVKELVELTTDKLNDFATLFVEKDKLLRSKGAIPLYYWFYTNNDVKKNRFRKFLEQFTDFRLKNRRLSDVKKANSTLLQFDRLNQQGAHQKSSLDTRYNMLNFYYNLYVSNNHDPFTQEMNISDSSKDEEYEV